MKRTNWSYAAAIALLLIALSPHLPAISAPPAAQLIQQGTEQYEAGKVQAAIVSWQRARTAAQRAKDRQAESTALANLSMAYVVAERYGEAVDTLEALLSITRSLGDQTSEARALGNLGIAYKALGNYSKAITAHRQAGKLMQSLGDRQGLGQVLVNLGNAFEAVADYDSAQVAYAQSLKIAQQTGDRVGESIALGNLGAIHANRGKNEEAIAAFGQSLDLAKATHHIPSQASALLNLGSVYHALAKLDQAIPYYQDSLKLARAIGDRRREAEALGSLGLAYEDRKDFTRAIEQHQKSLAIGRSLNNPEIQGKALNNLGHALFEAGKLAEAEKTLRVAVRLLDSLRPDLNDNYRVSIFDTQLHTYSLLQQVLIAAKKPELALEAAEWGRARAFAERIAARAGEGRRGKGKGERGKDEGRGMKAKGTVVQRSSVATAVAPIKIADIRRIAREQRATLVEYAIVPDDDFKFRGKQRGRESELLIWVVQPTGKIHFRRVDLKPLWQQNLTLAKLVSVARNCLYPGSDCREVAEPTSSSASSLGAPTGAKPQRRKNPALHRLHQLLIAPIADLLPPKEDDRVVFIPQESLFLVPFPALQNSNGTYLVEQHTPLTAPAIQVLALTRQINQAEGKRETLSPPSRFSPALIIGNPTMPKIGAEPLPQLVAAETEATQIAELLKAKALVGREATQNKVVQKMAGAKLVHLATHGLLEYGQNLGETDVPGAIALAPDPYIETTGGNGILTASEILDLRLPAKLVVLSACDTGRGRITGDGVIGLSRAFIAAGVPSIVVSLWAVSDVSTAQLMVTFYRNLLQQPNKAKALRLAMLETMKTYPRPIDWAAFTLMGEAE